MDQDGQDCYWKKCKPFVTDLMNWKKKKIEYWLMHSRIIFMITGKKCVSAQMFQCDFLI